MTAARAEYPNTQDTSNAMRGENVVQAYDYAYSDAYYSWSPYYTLAEEDLRFYLGDQYDARERQKLFEEGRNAYVFNRVQRNINLVTGYQRKNRLSSVVLPFENDDTETADLRSQVLMHVMNKSDGYNIISDCFGGAMKTGWNLCSLWKDYRDDPVNGDIYLGRTPYNGFICDPYFTKLDFSDCAFIAKRKYLPVDIVASLLPKYKKDVYEIHKFGWERDDKYTWLPYQRQPNGDYMMAYDEYVTRGWESISCLVDQETGEYTEFDQPQSVIKQYLEAYPQLKEVKKQKRFVEKHIILNSNYITTIRNPDGLNDYSDTPIIALFESESDQWELKIQSAVRCQKDPQKEGNRRRSQMSDILDSQLNSGWIAEQDSVVNPRALFKTGQGKVIWTKSGISPKQIQQIQAAQIPPSMFQLQETYDKDMVEIAGINDAAFGQLESANESGVAMMLRQGAAITNLQGYFDNLRLAQKHISQKIMLMIQQWTPAKIKRITGKDPTEAFYDYESIKYDISIQEGILTETQRQMHFRQLIDLKELGAPVTGEMLAKAAPIQGKTEYTQQIAEIEKQNAEAAKKQEEIEQQLLQAQQNQSTAKAISDTALAKERFTRSMANLGLNSERQSEAIQNRTQGVLNQIKGIKELEAMDDAKIERYLNMILQLENMSKTEEKSEEKEDLVITELSENLNAKNAQTSMQQQPINPQMEGMS